ncbi:PepSY domain-containing protein [Pseudoduganella sp. GCM10020061]|uniref:PepSY domain-containing protein n=1 Tax=Pseudoduganella sp. GCM10020061 TaxID=3317345 RepID=UPI003643BF52
MQTSFWVRRVHKWLGLVVGVQALLWMISGLYMVVVPLEIIHGDHLAHLHGEPLQPGLARIGSAELARQYPGITALKLKTLGDREVYELRQDKQVTLVDAVNGARLSPIPDSTVRALAQAAYTGDGPITKVEWITKAPQEVGTRPVPMWAVHFDDAGKTTFYYAPDTGELLARRHELWRWFDFVWMLHIMDYEAREDVNNTLLRVASITGLVFALSGAWLLLYSFNRRKRT